MDKVVNEFIHSGTNIKLVSALNKYLIEQAWDKVSGAKDYTIKRFYKNGKLYITLNSSLVRTQLNFQREDIRKSINQALFEDELAQAYHNDAETVKELIIK